MNRCFFAITLTAFCIPTFAQEREKDDHQKERDEWFYSQRSYPRTEIPAGARLNAIAEIRRIDRAVRANHRQPLAAAAVDGSLAAALDASTWTSIGPKPTDLASTYVTAGRVNAIAIDPRDNNVVYMGAAEGGVWKTTDGGLNWKPLTDDQASLASGAIAIDPTNPDTVYVGTGEENFAQDSYYGAGILKSTNGGASWTNIVGPFVRTTIGALAISPSNSQILLASSRIGIYRSTDGAATWTQVMPGTGTSVLFDPTDANIAYAAIGNVNGSTANGAFRSTDGGQTWKQLTGSGSSALPTTNVGRIEIAIAPSTPTTLYVGIQNSSQSNFGSLLGIFKTTDSGDTWNNLNAPNICANVGQCWYDMTIRVHPKNPDIVFAFGSLTMARTLTGGSTWSTLNFIGPNRVQIHVDEHYLAFTNDGAKLYVANDGGMYSTTDISASANQVNWTELNDTLSITQFYPGLSIHPSNSDVSFAGAQDNGTQRFGGTVSWNNVTCGDGGFTAVDAAIPTIAYAACQDIAIRRTTNTGTNWIVSVYGINQQDNTQFISPLVIDPSNSQVLYFGTFRVWQSVDGTGKWLPASPDLAKSTIKTIAPAPGDPNTVYTGFANGKVFMTSNALAGPNSSWTDRSSGLPTRSVTQIVVDPIDPSTAYVTFSGFALGTSPTGHVFKTTNGGQSWNDISVSLADIPVDTLAIDPDIPDTLYIGTDAGVMVSTDAGATWSTLGNGLPRVVVTSLVLHRKTRILRAGTHGRSIWDILVPLASASRQPSIASVSPGSINAGNADFTLAVTGTNLAAGTKLRFNGQTRSTNIVDSTHLTALITAADVAQSGRVNLDAINSSRGAGVSNSLPFNIGPPPVSSTAAFVSAANTPGNALAPRSIATLYGANMASFVSLADSPPPLPISLAGTTLTLTGNGTTNTLPLFFVSPGQINFQLPFAPVGQYDLTIVNGQLSSTIKVSLATYSPSLFTTNSQGTGQAAALVNSTSILVAPTGMFPGSRPAAKGEFIQLYCTGLGDVVAANRPGLGAASPSNPPAATLVQPTVTMGTADANVVFSGLSPGFVGLYQVNLQIPPNAPSGNAVPVILTIGGVKSNTVTIAIQ